MPSEKDGFFVIGHRKGALRLCPERAEERSEMAEEANENQAAGGEETFWSSGILTGNQTIVCQCISFVKFWSSGILTGNQT